MIVNLRAQNKDETYSISSFKPMIFFSSIQMCGKSKQMTSRVFPKFRSPKFHDLPSFFLGHVGYFFVFCYSFSGIYYRIYQVKLYNAMIFSIFTELYNHYLIWF